MKETKLNGEGGLEGFNQTKEYFVGFSFKEIVVQGILDFANAQVMENQGMAIDRRLLYSRNRGSITLGEIKRYIELRRIRNITLSLNYTGDIDIQVEL